MSSVNDQVIPIYAGWIGSWQISVSRRPLGGLELANRYDRMAAKWTRLTERFGYSEAYEHLWTRVLREVGLAPTVRPIRVLDCGVGTGSFSLAFARMWNAPIQMQAVDLSDEMIRQARERFQNAGLEVAFERVDARALPYADNQFDLVMAAHVLEHMPDPVVALKAIHRVLRPGGWFVACLTRESILGRYIQLKWRTHRLTPKQGESWLRAAGLDAHHTNVTPTGRLQRSSLIFLGRKPAKIQKEFEL